MKLVIQIPCYNEERTLSMVLQGVPNEISGITSIKSQVINDGSTDKTVAVAIENDVDYILNNIGNKGLGNSFRIGMEHALKNNADILVNTDGDNQYPSKYISDLVAPIIKGEADIVIGDRQTSKIEHFSLLKKILQWLGTKVTLILSGEKEVADAVSGFRAYSRQAMLELNVTSSFSYVLDTTVQASNKKLKLVSVPITTNPPTRPSRLFKNIWQHIRKSSTDLLRVYSMYKPLRVFFWLGIVTFLIGAFPLGRFVFQYFLGDGGSGMIQSLIFGAIFISVSINFFALGIIGDLIGKNRTLIEYTLKEIKQFNSDKKDNS